MFEIRADIRIDAFKIGGPQFTIYGLEVSLGNFDITLFAPVIFYFVATSGIHNDKNLKIRIFRYAIFKGLNLSGHYRRFGPLERKETGDPWALKRTSNGTRRVFKLSLSLAPQMFSQRIGASTHEARLTR